MCSTWKQNSQVTWALSELIFSKVFTSMYEFEEACLPPTFLHNTLWWSKSSKLTSAHIPPFQHFTNRRIWGHGGKWPLGILDSQHNIILPHLCRCLVPNSIGHADKPAPLTAHMNRWHPNWDVLMLLLLPSPQAKLYLNSMSPKRGKCTDTHNVPVLL